MTFNRKKMRNLIKKILKEEQDFDSFDWVEIPEFEENPARDFLYNLMQGLKISESKNRPGWMIYRDKKGEILMADDANIDQKNPALYVNYYKIWEKLTKMGLDNEEIRQLLISTLEMAFNRKVVTARGSRIGSTVWIGNGL